ncbi:hypothetical protein PoB_003982100 [Plakobranchus ocellatus]|uniref:Uncharacterized protein n=1 Tax=Plakobranchus ocellatus TaxID=259542 RepID=A0AAV4AQ85_9GAST|nr:hypothetical protein PoB_003982100 [Plakobranchus ocellatus]
MTATTTLATDSGTPWSTIIAARETPCCGGGDGGEVFPDFTGVSVENGPMFLAPRQVWSVHCTQPHRKRMDFSSIHNDMQVV